MWTDRSVFLLQETFGQGFAYPKRTKRGADAKFGRGVAVTLAVNLAFM